MIQLRLSRAASDQGRQVLKGRAAAAAAVLQISLPTWVVETVSRVSGTPWLRQVSVNWLSSL